MRTNDHMEPTRAEPTTAEPTTAEPTTAEPTTAEPTTAEPTTAADLQHARRRADQVHSRLVELGATVATAESLTGGLLGVLLTDSPATSVTYRGGLIVYGSDTKGYIAGVDEDLLAEHGPVHPSVAEQLAVGARERVERRLRHRCHRRGRAGRRRAAALSARCTSASRRHSESAAHEHHFDGTRGAYPRTRPRRRL